MDPIELNAGRFYLRPLRHDERVDDTVALGKAHGRAVTEEYIADAHADFAAGRVFRWAVCEQADVELIGEVIVTPVDEDEAEIVVYAAGDPKRVIENDDPTVEPVTVSEGCTAAKDTVRRWVEQSLGRKAVAPRPYPGRQGESRPVS
ncbi:hypothetical protein KRX51_06535 [Corynebacterium sp. TAE3-ERU12]|uniref:GNAT family N-acetyltransferase n=1 Tax=Corynebacterium sp. TAE3-ERU12 TaxID=2849491 RepID=UPI001C4936C8|nr:hypothetical protein [Corynebacterium sp. TAE3-ERU12]MBV7295573.1 hypothetical protein [Corynebacterium sp. TAE3-ERU12]